VYLLVFHAYVNEVDGSSSKIPSKQISSGSVARRDLIPALKGYGSRANPNGASLFYSPAALEDCPALKLLEHAIYTVEHTSGASAHALYLNVCFLSHHIATPVKPSRNCVIAVGSRNQSVCQYIGVTDFLKTVRFKVPEFS
jgi:hypothetical protein